MYAVLQSPYLVLQFANLGIVHGVLRTAAACAARLAARRLRVLVPPSSVVWEIYAMRADAIRHHAQVIMPVRQVRQLETNRLQGSTGRHPHSAEVVSPAIVHLMCSFIFQSDEGIVRCRIAVISIDICLREAVQLRAFQEVVTAAQRMHSMNRRPPGIV